MRLFVNGIEIPVKGKLEVLMDLADEGESLPPFATITIRGGEFRIHGTEESDGLTIFTDYGLSIASKGVYAGIRIESKNPLPLTPERLKELEEALAERGATMHIHKSDDSTRLTP